MIAAVLSVRFNTHRTEKNFNNELGVPWTLLRLDDENQVSVVEMGINRFGEMRRLTHMVRPTIAVFTVIGDAHLEFLGDRPGVLRAKGEIFEGMDAGGLAVLNGDDPLLQACHPDMRRVTYGKDPTNDVWADDICSDGVHGLRFTVHHPEGAFEAEIAEYGAHLVYAALAAAAVGLALGMRPGEIAEGFRHYKTVGNRARVIDAGGLKIVSDCYNANPNSMRAAIDSLAGIEGRKVAILGDMLELGDASEALHRGVGEYAARGGVDLVIGCGALANAVAEGAEYAGGQALYYADRDALIADLPKIVRPGDVVLVKASHSLAFERIVEALEK